MPICPILEMVGTGCWHTNIVTAIGTHVLTGFVMTAIMALGHFAAMTLTMSLIIPALTLKRSSRVMPGLRGTPAGNLEKFLRLTVQCPRNFIWTHKPSSAAFSINMR
uniref:Uncharacterized protein n=1 Tax=Glossina palpalis gambiensis TaxID=67801 RepID=A0A1B0BFC0_9MUSC